MDLRLHRVKLGEKATIGYLTVNGEAECITLEDVVRTDPVPGTPANEAKVYGATAISNGRYQVDITMSQRFGRMMPLLLEVPGFTGIRIHSGNTDQDTLGCILVGQTVEGDDLIRGGSKALPILQRKVQDALDQGEQVWITITDEFGGGA